MVGHLGQEYHRGDVVPFSARWEDMMSICLIAGDADLDYLVKVVSVGFLLCKVTIFPFVINNYPGRKNLRICTHTVSPQTFTTN